MPSRSPRAAALAVLAVLGLPQGLGSPTPPEPRPPQVLEVMASWYGPGFHGKLMSNRKRFDQMAMTVAHRAWPFGARLVLFNPETGRYATVVVTDRGPYIDRRGLDVSMGVAEKLGFKDKGLARLVVTFLEEK